MAGSINSTDARSRERKADGICRQEAGGVTRDSDPLRLREREVHRVRGTTFAPDVEIVDEPKGSCPQFDRGYLSAPQDMADDTRKVRTGSGIRQIHVWYTS